MDTPRLIATGLNEFIRSHPNVALIDQRESQLLALFLVRHPEKVSCSKNDIIVSKEYRRFVRAIRFNFFFFPWLKKVVSVLPENDHDTLKTSRNKPLIEKNDQKKLHDYRIAIIGLSVGSNIAHSLGLMGCANFVLCDHDNLECVNFNRLLGGVDEVGINKAELVARRLYGNNPYARIDVLDTKMTTRLLTEVHRKQKIDMVVEEIDSLEMKIEIRKWAKKYGVAVVMLTSNVHGAIIDVERYDLNRELPILGRKEKYWTNIFLDQNGSIDKRIEIISKIVGRKYMDPRMSIALKEIGKSLVTWPQLITAGMVEGAVGAATILNIITRKDNKERYRRKIAVV